MIFNYPFLGFRNKYYPYKYYNYPVYQNKYNKSYNNISTENLNLPSVGLSGTPALTKKFLENQQQINKTLEKRNSNEKEQFFSILGIKLYFDDLIILALLLFLYSENVKDDGLFICLILLLIS